MKKIPNTIFMILGIIIIALEFYFMIDGMLGFLLIFVGVMSIGISMFKGNNPLTVIAQFLINIF